MTGTRPPRSGDADTFPGVGGDSLRSPPRTGAPRKQNLANGLEVKWCALCGQWTDHYHASHPTGEEDREDDGDGDGNVAIEGITETTEEVDDDSPPSGAFT